MRNRVFAGIAVAVAFVAGMSIGAVRPDDSYHQASSAVQGELAVFQFLSDTERREACKARADHWIQIMEKFKP